MYGSVPRNSPGAVNGSRMKVVAASAPSASSCGPSLARPKSSSFTRGAPLDPDQHHVRGFEVAVDDAAAVRDGEGIADLRADVEHLPERQGSRSQALGERPAFDVLHHEEVQRAAGRVRPRRMHGGFAPDVVQDADVRVLERGGRARFVFEPAAAVGIGGRERRQDLDGDSTAQAGVAGLVDLAHPAGPDRSLDLVGAEPEAGRQRHGSPPGAEWPVPRGRTASNDSERRAASPIILGPRGND